MSSQQVLGRFLAQESEPVQQERGELLAVNQLLLSGYGACSLLRKLELSRLDFVAKQLESVLALEKLALQGFDLGLGFDQLVTEIVDLSLEFGKLLQAAGEGILKPPFRLPGADQI